VGRLSGLSTECSTPYGIRGLGTLRPDLRFAFRIGAQRLTASEVWARLQIPRTAITQCVLNALRHQRFGHETPSDKARLLRACSTPYGIRGLGTGPLLLLYLAAQSAQRLTASEVWAPAAVSNSAFFSSSAQRLTASEVWALVPHPYGYPLGRVLNALRHQRFGHGWCLAIPSLTPRAQRLTASEVWAHSIVSVFIVSVSCSTPYGIRGLGTAKKSRRTSQDTCAQRLTASEVWARRDVVSFWIFIRVLNALRHQRFGHI